MKKTLQLIMLCSVMSLGAFGQVTRSHTQSLPESAGPIKANLISSDIKTSTVNCTTSGFTLSEINTSRGTQNILDVPDGIPLYVKGAPDLRRIAIGLIIPDQGTTKVAVLSADYKDYTNIEIAPSKGVLLISQDADKIPLEYGAEYTKNAFFPGTLAELREPHIMRNVRGQVVDIYPFQYNPVTKVLRVYSNITFQVTTDESEPGLNSFTRTVEHTVPGEFSQMYESLYLNYASSSKTRGITDANGRMLIICYDNFKTAIQPYVDWKIRKGIQVDLVGYSTVGSGSAAILTYVKNYYSSHPDFTYLVIVGDHPQVPSTMVSGNSSEQKYSQLVGTDANPEIIYGRISAETTADVDVQVKKFITYEKYPGRMASSRFNYGAVASLKLGPDNSTNVYLDMRAAKTTLTSTNGGYAAVKELYEQNVGDMLPSAANISAQINAGISYMSWISHGSSSSLVSFNFNTTSLKGLTNTTMWPMIWNCSCQTGNFATGSSPCFSEVWMRASKNGDPIGAIGTAMSSHDMPMGPSEKLGPNAAKYLVDPARKNKTYGGITVDTYIKTAINDYKMPNEFTWMGMFADPSLQLRTKTPMNMTVTHNAKENIGLTSLVVGSNVQDAYIALTQKNKIIGTGYINNGTVTINFSAITTTDTLFVTGTGFNYSPYLGYVLINSATGITDTDQNSSINVFPNPSNGAFTISGLTGENSVEIFDVAGKLVYQTISKNTSAIIDLKEKDKGVYFYKVTNTSTNAVAEGKILVD